MPIAVLAIVVALIAPMPTFLLDVLIAFDIAMSVIVLMVYDVYHQASRF